MQSLLFILAGLFSLSVASASRGRLCPEPWESAHNNQKDCASTLMSVPSSASLMGSAQSLSVSIRHGFLRESSEVPFKGNIIYYEGLGDSMLNHGPLFEQLTMSGYRVIAFDYMGQGGSSGSMDDTEIPQIGSLGNAIWKKQARDLSGFPRKTIIGWSTGGLAAFYQSQWDSELSRVVLIAPGIAPNWFVGEQHLLSKQIDQITLSSLTTEKYLSGVFNPHMDPIKPTSPLDVPYFALNLQKYSHIARRRPLNPKMEGLVLLSGSEDTYVDADKTINLFRTYAPNFIRRQYKGALHEIDNEAYPMGPSARQDIVNFLNVF